MKSRVLAAATAVGVLGLAGPVSAVPTAADTEVRETLEAGLQELALTEVRVAVSGGEVLLQGRVRLLDHSLRAEQLAWKTEGVVDVENEIRVVALTSGGDDAIEQRIRTLVKGDERFTHSEIRVEVTGGVVRLSGLFRDPSDVLALKHRVAEVPGVLDLVIDAVLIAGRGGPGRPTV